MSDPFAWMVGQVEQLQRDSTPFRPREKRYAGGVHKVAEFVEDQHAAVCPEDIRRAFGYSNRYAAELLNRAARLGLVEMLPKRHANDAVRVIRGSHDAS